MNENGDWFCLSCLRDFEILADSAKKPHDVYSKIQINWWWDDGASKSFLLLSVEMPTDVDTKIWSIIIFDILTHVHWILYLWTVDVELFWFACELFPNTLNMWV